MVAAPPLMCSVFLHIEPPSTMTSCGDLVLCGNPKNPKNLCGNPKNGGTTSTGWRGRPSGRSKQPNSHDPANSHVGLIVFCKDLLLENNQ